MQKTSWYFLFAGALSITLASSFMLLGGFMPLWMAPMPFYLVFSFWLISFGSIFILPVIYIFEVLLLDQTKHLGNWVLAISSGVFFLDFLYLIEAWEYGFKYQGRDHTMIVIAENLIVMCLILSLILLGFRKKTAIYHRVANLVLFLFLAWCAFPYLGEMP
jgi:hypothetical protein